MKIIPITKISTPLKLKVHLENMPLKVYRIILVPESINMMQMHHIIQLSMGWEFAHLFEFTDNKVNYSIAIKLPDEYDDDFFPFKQFKSLVPEKVQLKNEFLLMRESRPFYYTYDFGDGWLHKISFQKVTKKDLANYNDIPICVDASGACPPEDVGGPWGYNDLLFAINDKKHPQYKEYREWLGLESREKFDETYVDIHVINELLNYYYHSSDWNSKSNNYFND